ncbi:MAG TPA: hypothetical protein P5081_16305 [Phycisphaerae bacterium]|nr:hypothetical protein [Phycisphaerae bacterium]HRW54434.1 hypothetical protein [Phycisphaerae bacterium]
MIISPQDRCLHCDYALEGLPAPHRCPECGEAYDDATTIFRPRVNWKWFVPTIGVQFYAVYLVASNWKALVRYMGDWGAVAAVVMFVGFIIVRAVRFSRALRERPCQAALTRTGLAVRTRFQRVAFLPYDEIAFVSVVDTHPWVQRKEYGTGRSASVARSEAIEMRGIFENDTEMRAFKRMVSERMERVSAGVSEMARDNADGIHPAEPIHVRTRFDS